MGTVFLGEDLTTENKVAIKIIRPEINSDKALLARFKREIDISKSFAHPFVIKILDGGFLQSHNIFYLTMEFLEGKNMGAAFSHTHATNEETRRILLHMAEAFSYIHTLEIFHRDVKPDNILIASKERTVLLDFGLALCDDKTRLSRTSDRPGTWITMSPEQLSGDPLDGRSDIYSLGVSMYIATTGNVPYSNDKIIALATGIDVSPPPPVHVVNPAIDRYLSHIIMRCIEPSPTKRFQSADELKQAIVSKSMVPPGIQDDASTEPSIKETTTKTRSRRKSCQSNCQKTLRRPQTCFIGSNNIIKRGHYTQKQHTKENRSNPCTHNSSHHRWRGPDEPVRCASFQQTDYGELPSVSAPAKRRHSF